MKRTGRQNRRKPVIGLVRLLLGTWLLTAMCLFPLTDGAATASLSSLYRFDDWQTEHGLPQNSISAIAQTLEGGAGYLWLGTYNGLVRFDGVRFRIYDPSNTPELRSGRILTLHVDRQNVLWIGTEGGGLVRYAGGQFHTYSTDDGLANNSVTAIYTDRSETLWVGTMGGTLHRFRDGQFTPYTFRGELAGNAVEGIVETEERELWIATSDALGRFSEGEFLRYPLEQDSQVRLGSNRAGGFWVTINNRLYRFKPGEAMEEVGTLPALRNDSRVTALFEDIDGNLWIATYGSGLIRYRDGVFTTITTQDGLTQDIVLALYRDREGNLWIGTNGGGLNRMKDRVFALYDTSSGLHENVALTVTEGQDGSIWIGTDGGGLSRILNGEVTHIGENEGLRSGNVWAVLEDREKDLWIGTQNGLYRRHGTQISRLGKRDGLSSENVRSLYLDHSGRLWIGTYDGGLNLYSQGRFSTKAFTTEDGLSNNDIRAIFEDHEGTLWIGTAGGGLNNLRNGQFAALHRRDGLASEFIRVIYEDKDGFLWIGTNGGISLYRNGHIWNFTSHNGLPDDVISQIFLDNEGFFWIGSNRGIFRVRRSELVAVADGRVQTYTCVSYDKSDGLGARECTGGSQPAGWRSSDGRLWFPTIHGVAVVDPANLRVNRRPPSVVIEDLVVDGVPTDITPELRIPPGHDRLEFHYTGFSFTAPKRVMFKYKLEGLDKDWVNAESRRMAFYPDVPPGKYKFHVIAANNDGVWNDIGATLAFTVNRPFWQTEWFAVLVATTFALMLWGILRYLSLKKLRRKILLLEQQHALEKERARIAQDMHDDLGASITQIGLLCELMKRQVSGHSEIVPLADRMIGTSRDVVNTLDEIVWAVNPKNDKLNELAAYIAQYAEDYFEASSIRCRLDVPPNLPAAPLSAEMRHNIFMVVKEALNNIVKHSQAAEVWIRFSVQDKVLTLAIEDNGRGFTLETATNRRNGLQNMKKRVEESGGGFQMTSEPGKGTRIQLQIKFSAK